MSARQIQINRVLEEVIRTRYSSGIKPTLNQILSDVSAYFSLYPAGLAVSIPIDDIRFREVADVKTYNQIVANSVLNLDVLYETAIEDSERMQILTVALQRHLDRLRAKRKRIETTIDDYLLSLYNTDGYYFSVSDTFADLSMSDLTMTSAYVDAEAGSLELPALSSFSTKLDRRLIGNPAISVTKDNVATSFKSISSFFGAIEDSVDNLIWATEIESNAPAEIIMTVVIPIDNSQSIVDISRVEFIPYGLSPVQLLLETGHLGLENSIEYTIFGGRIETSNNKIVLTDEAQDIISVRLTLRKTKHDFTRVVSGTTKYVYMFGAKEISFINRVFDNSAIFVSTPLSGSEELDEFVIDAVSVVVDQETPSGTSIKFYMASEPDNDVNDITDFDWKEIQPSVEGDSSSASVLRFDGASTTSRNINSHPVGSDIQLIPFNDVANDLNQRNPTPALIPGVDVYRLCGFEDEVFATSLILEEGINSTRSYYVDLHATAVTDLSYWTDILSNPTTRTVYGRIDTGNDFFYGGDIGESNISVYTEAFLYAEDSRDTFLSEFSKPDQFSQSWEVRVFLNGREIGYLPVGTNKAVLPWTIREGKNQIIILSNIPSGKGPGTLKLLASGNLNDFGTVKFDDWNYVDFFDMQYNQNSSHKTFTINSGQIVSRYKPSDNFRLTFSRSTGKGPTAVRLRADLLRDFNKSKITPKLNSYRIRFSFGDDG